jgi:hypothetical protein
MIPLVVVPLFCESIARFPSGRGGDNMTSNSRRRHMTDQTIGSFAEGNKLGSCGQEHDAVGRILEIV